MKGLIPLALLICCTALSANGETVVYVEITYPTPTTWALWLTETENWDGTSAFTPSGNGIAAFALDVKNALTALRATPAPVDLMNLDDPPVQLGRVGFPVGPVNAFIDQGTAQCFGGQDTTLVDGIFKGFGVTAGAYSVPDPTTQQISAPFSWDAPGLPGSDSPGVLVYRGKRSPGETLLFGPDFRMQANVFNSNLPLDPTVTTVRIVGFDLPRFNWAPLVDAGRSQYIGGMTATLAGSISDDGLPDPPAATTVTWALWSGPGTVTFADPHALATTATFSRAGTYILYLWANDSQETGLGSVRITVLTENQAPVVDAGPDQVIPTGMIAILAGSVSDDGLPNPPAATKVTWSMTSGPANVTFTDANAAHTSVQFAKFGTYVLHLRADDSARTADDEVTLIVHADPPGDFTGDGHVTGVDFLIWQQNYPTISGATRAKGDANGDGRVTGMDFMLWQIDYGLEHQ